MVEERKILETKLIMGYSGYQVKYADINPDWNLDLVEWTRPKNQVYEIMKEFIGYFRTFDRKVCEPCDSEITWNLVLPNPYYTTAETYKILSNVLRRMKISHEVTPSIPVLSDLNPKHTITMYDMAIDFVNKINQKSNQKAL